jgi:hypothetical protein
MHSHASFYWRAVSAGAHIMNKICRFFQHHGHTVVLAMTLVAALGAQINFISTGVRGSDDNLLFYMSGLNVAHETELLTLNNRAINHFKQKRQTRPHAMKRLILHRDYLNEYPLPGMIYYGVSRIFKPLFDPLPSLYPMYLSQSIVFGFVVCFVFAIGALIGIFAIIKRRLFTWALAITVIFYAFIFFLPLKFNAFANLMLHDNLWGVAKNTLEMLFHPSAQFSPLSFTPRSNFALLMIGVFALRWRNRYFLSYLLVIGLSFIHLSTSGMILALLFGMDVALRPQIFRRPLISLSVALGGLNFVMRESMFDALIGGNSKYLLIAGLGGLIAMVFVVIKTPFLYRTLIGPKSIYAMVQKWLLARGAVGADLILLTLVWLLSAIITYSVVKHLNLELFEPWFQAFYFWGRVSGRLLMAVAPAILFGICLLSLRALIANRGWFRRQSILIIPGILALILGALIWQSTLRVRPSSLLPRVASDFFKIEERIKKGSMPRLKAMGFSEAVLFYAISKTVDGKTKPLNSILR